MSSLAGPSHTKKFKKQGLCVDGGRREKRFQKMKKKII